MGVICIGGLFFSKSIISLISSGVKSASSIILFCTTLCRAALSGNFCPTSINFWKLVAVSASCSELEETLILYPALDFQSEALTFLAKFQPLWDFLNKVMVSDSSELASIMAYHFWANSFLA